VFAADWTTQPSTLLIERPRPTEDHPGGVPPRTRVDLYLHTDTLRLVAAHEVLETVNFQLNDRLRVSALRTVRIGDVQSAQRRASFRVDTTAAGFEKITINASGLMQSELRPVSGHLLNLSAGGVGIRIDRPAQELTEFATQPFDIVVTLPENGEMLTVPARGRRLVPESRTRTYLGLEFQFESHARHRQISETLARLAADLQRKQLRRRRSA
jgi:c-di-GMP-binding flagellar brake protein YcgR